MVYWSVEKKRHQSFSHYSNTPLLQYSEIHRRADVFLSDGSVLADTARIHNMEYYSKEKLTEYHNFSSFLSAVSLED